MASSNPDHNDNKESGRFEKYLNAFQGLNVFHPPADLPKSDRGLVAIMGMSFAAICLAAWLKAEWYTFGVILVLSLFYVMVFVRRRENGTTQRDR